MDQRKHYKKSLFVGIIPFPSCDELYLETRILMLPSSSVSLLQTPARKRQQV